MSEVKKSRILIASVLKPVNDTRMAEKIAQSLAGTRQFEIHLIGFPASQKPGNDFYTHPLPCFKRLSFTRFFIPWKILRKTLRIRPALFIITTHELLLTALLAKLITGCRIVYDIQENYYRNILFTSAFPFLLRPFIAFYVRAKEVIAAPFTDHFFLAEKAYANELRFLSQNYTVLENKLKKPAGTLPLKRNENQLLFSGTLAETTGIFKAIEIAVKLHALDKNISLCIIGYCSQPTELSKIKKAIEPYSFIQLTGGDRLVPHDAIVEQIQRSGAGIISYPFNKSTVNSVPTKLYEYLGYKLPILLVNHLPWVALCQQYHAACIFNPHDIKPASLLQTLKTGDFYSREPAGVFWESEQAKLTRQVEQLLNK